MMFQINSLLEADAILFYDLIKLDKKFLKNLKNVKF